MNRINIELDEELLLQVTKLSGAPTRRETVEEALRTYVRVKSAPR